MKRSCTKGMFSDAIPARWGSAHAVAAGSWPTRATASQVSSARCSRWATNFKSSALRARQIPPSPSPRRQLGLLSERIANVLPHGMGLAGGSLRFVDISGPRSHVVMTTGGGQVASLRRTRQFVAN